MDSGTYLIWLGDYFYVGSSFNRIARWREHRWMLRAGVHPNQNLTHAFSLCQTVELDRGPEISRGNLTKIEHKKALRDSEQALLHLYAGNPFMCNKSDSAYGPGSGHGDVLRKSWADPEKRERMVGGMRESAKLRVVSEETRKKMSEAKRGSRNAKSRAVEITRPDGSTEVFESCSAAAVFFKVEQQLMHLWMSGELSWPGEKSRKKNRWIAPYSARYLS